MTKPNGAYMVERTPDNFESVGAYGLKFHNGDLAFYDADGGFFVAFARGQWLTVHYDKDYEWKSSGLTTANEDARAAIAHRDGVVE